jgi:3-mercaptopropionate dioxygenase
MTSRQTSSSFGEVPVRFNLKRTITHYRQLPLRQMVHIMSISRLRESVKSFTALADRSAGDTGVMISGGAAILADLLSHDDWLPDYAAQPSEVSYRQYLLHCDVHERFSIVSFVWGPGQRTPVHDHTVWGLVGVLRGCELATRYQRTDAGLVAGEEQVLLSGQIDVLSPADGDIHQVRNGLANGSSVSIHVYGANIAAVNRSVFDTKSGFEKPFMSAYHNAVVPNLW